MTMRAPVLVQQFTLLVRIPVAPILEWKLSSPLVLALENCRQDRKDRNIQESKINEQKLYETDIRLDRKVMVPLSPSRIQLLALLGSPCCHPLLLPLLRWFCKLLASSGLC